MENIKLGHQADKWFKVNTANSIEIKGDFAYCKSHNFIYNSETEEEKLYNGKACYYTDSRYIDTMHNYFKNAYLHWTRQKDISTKAAIRKTLKCRNIPIGTIVSFRKSWHFTGNRFIDNSYKFKIRKENKFDPKYEINRPEYNSKFTSCKWSQNLVNNLRDNGFIVFVQKNESFIGNMLTTAKAYTGADISKDTNEIEGEYAIAYGFGKKIGFSSYNNDFQGYSSGEENILWDKFGEFNKWSQCEQILKETTSIDEILKILKS